MDGTNEFPVWGLVLLIVLALAYTLFMCFLQDRGPDLIPGMETEREKRAKAKKLPDPKQREQAYLMVCGEINMEDERTAELRSQLDTLVDVIYRHRVELCARTGLDFEDKDLVRMMSACDQVNQLCANAMYDQGWLDAVHRRFGAFKRRKAGPKA